MVEQANQAQLQSATEMVKTDVTLLAAQARSWAAVLFRAIARNDKDPLTAYNNFIEIFHQLYGVIRDNAEQTGKIKDWSKKRDSYDKIFMKVLAGEYMPIAILQVWEEFRGDLRACGIYDLSAGEYVRRS